MPWKNNGRRSFPRGSNRRPPLSPPPTSSGFCWPSPASFTGSVAKSDGIREVAGQSPTRLNSDPNALFHSSSVTPFAESAPVIDCKPPIQPAGPGGPESSISFVRFRNTGRVEKRLLRRDRRARRASGCPFRPPSASQQKACREFCRHRKRSRRRSCGFGGSWPCDREAPCSVRRHQLLHELIHARVGQRRISPGHMLRRRPENVVRRKRRRLILHAAVRAIEQRFQLLDTVREQNTIGPARTVDKLTMPAVSVWIWRPWYSTFSCFTSDPVPSSFALQFVTIFSAFGAVAFETEAAHCSPRTGFHRDHRDERVLHLRAMQSPPRSGPTGSVGGHFRARLLQEILHGGLLARADRDRSCAVPARDRLKSGRWTRARVSFGRSDATAVLEVWRDR